MNCNGLYEFQVTALLKEKVEVDRLRSMANARFAKVVAEAEVEQEKFDLVAVIASVAALEVETKQAEAVAMINGQLDIKWRELHARLALARAVNASLRVSLAEARTKTRSPIYVAN